MKKGVDSKGEVMQRNFLLGNSRRILAMSTIKDTFLAQQLRESCRTKSKRHASDVFAGNLAFHAQAPAIRRMATAFNFSVTNDDDDTG